ncbi:MAG: hypothetical protein ABIR91_03565 [Candidatus Saccharimonadales bacterium]
MKKLLLNYIAAIVFATSVGGGVMAMATTQPVSAATCSHRFLTFPAWYRGLTDGECNIKSPAKVGGVSNFIWRIALNVIEMVLQIIGYLAVGYIISAGSSDGMVKARKTVTNAAIGLVISILSVMFVNVIAGSLT